MVFKKEFNVVTVDPSGAYIHIYTVSIEFWTKLNAAEIHILVFDRCSVNQIITLCKFIFIFFNNSNIFRHLKLEIESAIPASNERMKIKTNNSGAEGLIK